MEEFKKALSDSGFIFGSFIFVVGLLIALLKWIIARILKHYDEEHHENKEEHKFIFSRLNSIDKKLSKLEGRTIKENKNENI
jgi:hypothetical protein